MKTFVTLALGTCMTVALAGAGFAQSTTSSMSNMSAAEQATLTKCKGLSSSAMQANADCAALMKKYPDMEQNTTGSGTSPSDTDATPSKRQGQ